MINLLKKYPVFSYILLAYLIAWLFRIPLSLYENGYISLFIPKIFQFIGDFGPFIGAVLVAYSIGGSDAIRNLFRKVTSWKCNPVWYGFAILGVPVIYFISYFISLYFFGHQPSSMQEYGKWAELPGMNIILTWLILTFFVGLGEEVGWRAFLQTRLQEKFNVATAAIFVGLIWIFWHIPLFFYDEYFSHLGAFQIFGWACFIIINSIIFAWLYNASGENLIIPILFHSSVDLMTGSPVMKDGYISTLFTIILILIAIFALIGFRPKYLNRKKPVSA